MGAEAAGSDRGVVSGAGVGGRPAQPHLSSPLEPGLSDIISMDSDSAASAAGHTISQFNTGLVSVQ